MPLSVHDRLRDQDGPIAGLAGFSIKRTPSTEHCGGIKVTTTRSKTVAPADKQVATVYAIEFPSGLSFDPAKKKVKEASRKKVAKFIQTLTTTARDAATFYAGQIKGGDEPTKLAALARVTQIQFRVASVLARAEIPMDLRTGELEDEKVAAYCDKMRGHRALARAGRGGARNLHHIRQTGGVDGLVERGLWTAVNRGSEVAVRARRESDRART